MWKLFDGGSSINQIGSENGVIIKDEEHSLGARITIEKNGYIAPFSITCGIYGCFAHTAFCGDEQEANEKYEEMKTDMELFLHDPNDTDEYLSEWCSQFAGKY